MSAWDEIRAEAKHVDEMYYKDNQYFGGQTLAHMILSIPLHCRPTEFTYTTLSDDDVNCTVWQVKAQWRGPGDRWAILASATASAARASGSTSRAPATAATPSSATTASRWPRPSSGCQRRWTAS